MKGPFWRLMIFAAPDSLGGLLARHGFRRTKKNPNHWWRVFDASSERDEAAKIHALFGQAGLVGKWGPLDAPARRAGANPRHPHFSFLKTSRTSGLTVASRNPKNRRRHGGGRRGM